VHNARRQRTPIVSYYDGLLFAEEIDEADNISAEVENAVVFDSLWPIRLAVATLVRCDDVISSLRQCLQLMPPRVPQLWKAVAKDN